VPYSFVEENQNNSIVIERNPDHSVVEVQPLEFSDLDKLERNEDLFDDEL